MRLVLILCGLVVATSGAGDLDQAQVRGIDPQCEHLLELNPSSEDPGVEAEMLEHCAQQMVDAFDYATAASYLERALELRRSIAGAQPKAIAQTAEKLAAAYRLDDRLEAAAAMLDTAHAAHLETPESPLDSWWLERCRLAQETDDGETALSAAQAAVELRRPLGGAALLEAQLELAEVYLLLARSDDEGLLLEQIVADADDAAVVSNPRLALAAARFARLDDRIAEEGIPILEGAIEAARHDGRALHIDTFALESRLAFYIQRVGRHTEAAQRFEALIATMGEMLGQESKELLEPLYYQCQALRYAGEVHRALRVARRALAIAEKFNVHDSQTLGMFEHEVASSLHAVGYYDEAVKHYYAFLALLRATVPEDDRDLCVVRCNLAVLHYKMGQLDDAEALLREVIAVRPIGGADFMDISFPRYWLVAVLRLTGRFGEAETVVRETLAMYEKAGVVDDQYAQCLRRLGHLAADTARWQSAEALQRRALAVARAALEPTDPRVHAFLDDLAEVLMTVGQLAEAHELLVESHQLLRSSFGDDHVDLAEILSNLGRVNALLERSDDAERWYRQALELSVRHLGESHHEVATSLHRLGSLYADSGKTDKAIENLGRALEIRRQVFGQSHEASAETADLLAGLLASRGEHEAAHALLHEAVIAAEHTRREALSLLGEDQQLDFMVTQEARLHRFLGHTASHLADHPGAVRHAFDAWLRFKGSVLDAHGRHLDAVASSDDPAVQKVFRDLQGVWRELAGIRLVDSGGRDPEDRAKRMETLERRKIELEEHLARLSREYSLEHQAVRLDTDAVADLLDAHTAYLDFARVSSFDAASAEPVGARYLLLTLTPGGRPELSMVDLGQAAAIDNAVAELTRRLQRRAPLWTIEGPSRQLWSQLYASIGEQLAGRRRLLVSPDGALHRLPFEILQGPEGDQLIDRHIVSYLSSGRDLLRRVDAPRQGARAVVVGDPDFDLDGMALAPEPGEAPLPALRGGVSRGVGSLHFARLPATRAEAQEVASLLGQGAGLEVALFVGTDATESVLLDQRSPAVLHLATHGFFLDNVKRASDAQRASGNDGRAVAGESPLLRAGLAMAGANAAIADGRHDGLVSAAKVLGLDLRGTELVVLSACDTAAGEVHNGEGVFGLQRAFLYAGTQSLIMTRWQVEDEATADLMRRFYANWTAGQAKAEALRAAMLTQREESAHPAGWAAPMLVGSWQ